MNNIIFIAPPAAGKGTMSSLISNKYFIPHISTGDLLRNKIKEDNEEAKTISDEIAKGNLISDEIVNNLVRERLSLADADSGFILDGYPRTLNQATKLDELLRELNKEKIIVIYLDVDKKTAQKRALSRLVCSKCHKIYNITIEEAKPTVDGICDQCGTLLDFRPDDTEESFNKRFETYLLETEPLLKYYDNKKVLYKVNSKDTKTTFEAIERIMMGQK